MYVTTGLGGSKTIPQKRLGLMLKLPFAYLAFVVTCATMKIILYYLPVLRQRN